MQQIRIPFGSDLVEISDGFIRVNNIPIWDLSGHSEDRDQSSGVYLPGLNQRIFGVATSAFGKAPSADEYLAEIAAEFDALGSEVEHRMTLSDISADAHCD